jgi:hypothetical protein
LSCDQVAANGMRSFDGSDASSGGGNDWAASFKTIHKGVDGVSDGNMAAVRAQPCHESVAFQGKDIACTSVDLLDPKAVRRVRIAGAEQAPR